jgi:hypothetical protein
LDANADGHDASNGTDVYTHSDDKDELEAKARAAIIPIVTNSPG